MKLTESIFAIYCFIGFVWAFPWSPIAYINTKQLLYKNQYKLVDFEVEKLNLTCGDGCTAIAIGKVEGRTEKMGVGHFYLYEKNLPEVISQVLPADAEKLFKNGANITV